MTYPKKLIKATFFGKTQEVLAELYGMRPEEDHEEVLWVEREEDYYALLSPQLRGKRVAIVTRSAWLRASE